MVLRIPPAVLALAVALLALTAAARPAGTTSKALAEAAIPVAPIGASLGDAPRASLFRPSAFRAVFRATQSESALYVVAQWYVRDLTLTIVGPGAQRRTLVGTSELPGHILGVRLPNDAWRADRIELHATTVSAAAPPVLLAGEQLAELAWRTWAYPAFFGIFVLVALSHAVVARAVRSRAYAWFSAVAAASALLTLPWLGVMRPGPEISQPTNAALQTLLALALAAFTLSFLGSARIPRVLRVALWTAVALNAVDAIGFDVVQDFWPVNDLLAQVVSGALDAVLIAAGAFAVWPRATGEHPVDGAALYLAGTLAGGAGFAVGLFAGTAGNALVAVAPLAANALEALLFAFALAVPLRRGERVEAADGNTGIDALTGVATRTALHAALRRSWHDARARNAPLAALAIDVDHLGKYNATYGDAGGDDALRGIAATLARLGAAASAVVARYGDDEFVVILPNCDLAGAQRIAARVAAEINALAIAHDGVPARSLTASIGAAAIEPPHHVNATVSSASSAGPAFAARPPACDALLARATTALFIAKAMGRNRVVVDDAQPAAAARPEPQRRT